MNRTTSLAAAILILAAPFSAGCENAGQGALTGGGIGALSGLAIGSLTGSAGAGAAIGAISGAVGGAIIGDQNRRHNEEALRDAGAPPPPSPPAYQAVQALDGFVGHWRVDGWCQPIGGRRGAVDGEATGVAEKNFFVRLDLHLTDTSTGEVIQGTCVMAQEGGRTITMTNSFNTSPEVKRFRGDLDGSGSIFTLHQVSPPGNRRVVIRRSGGSGWVAEAWERGSHGEQRTESLTFTAMP